MFELLQYFFTQWNSDKNQRTKLQRAYFITIILLTAASGAATLFNSGLSRAIMVVAAFLAVVYLANGIMWLIADSIIAPKLPRTEVKSVKTTRRK